MDSFLSLVSAVCVGFCGLDLAFCNAEGLMCGLFIQMSMYAVGYENKIWRVKLLASSSSRIHIIHAWNLDTVSKDLEIFFYYYFVIVALLLFKPTTVHSKTSKVAKLN